MLFRATHELLESRAALSWPTVPGQVTRSKMKTHTETGRRKSEDGIKRSYNEEFYTADIEYEYLIDGVPYKGTRISAVQGGTRADKPHVQQTLDKYKIGQTVVVSYDPSDPSQSVLEPGSQEGFVVWAGLSLFLIFIPAVVIWVGWHPRYSRMISGL